jgi:hypothetical protein
VRSLFACATFACAAALAATGACAQSLTAQPAPAVPVQPIHWEDGAGAPDLISATYGNGLQSLAPASQNNVGVSPAGTVAWTSNETWFQNGSGAVDRLRVTQGSALVQAPGAPIWMNPTLGDQLFDVTYTRGWPQALSMRSGRFGVDVTPHAGLGVTNAGESAEAGAEVRFGGASALETLGAHGQPGKFYFYAQGSGRAVGYNLNRNNMSFRAANMFLQPEPGFVGDAEAGVAWRRGDLQASFGYAQRALHLDTVRDTDVNTRESMVAFKISLTPRR